MLISLSNHHLVKENEHESKYLETCKIARNTIYPAILLDCAKKFEEMGDYKNSKIQAEECRKRAAGAVEKQKEEELFCWVMVDCLNRKWKKV